MKSYNNKNNVQLKQIIIWLNDELNQPQTIQSIINKIIAFKYFSTNKIH